MGAALEIAAALKQKSSPPLVLLGGHHATNCYRDILENEPHVDGVALGDAERTFETLLASWPELRPGPSLITRENLTETDHRRYQEMQLDRLSWPLRPGLGGLTYGEEGRVVTSRGCPYRCAFCTTPAIYDHVAYRSVDDVVAEIAHLSRNGVKHVWLNDDLFVVGSNKSHQRAREFCAALREADLGVSFRPMARVDSFRKDPSLIDELIEAGMSDIFLGVEAGSDTDLLRLRKDAAAADNLRTLDLLYDKDVFVQIGFIMFNPWSNFEDLRANAAFLAQTGEGYRPFPYFRSLSVFPGTALWTQLAADGLQGQVTYKSGTTLDYDFADERVGRLSRLQHCAYETMVATDNDVYRTATRLRRSGDLAAWRRYRAGTVDINTRCFDHLLNLAEHDQLTPATHGQIIARQLDLLRQLVGRSAA